MSRFAFLAGMMGYVSVAIAQTRPTSDAPNLATVAHSAAAPVTVHVSATDVPLARGTLLTSRYEWDFGDPAAAFNRLVGFNAAHTYDRPGTYLIRLKLTDETGTSATYEHRVRVEAIRNRTIFVAENGDDRRDGASDQTPVKTLARAVALAGENTRILLRRGDRFELPATVALRKQNLLIGAYGRSVFDVFRPPAPAMLPDDRPRLVWSGPRTFATMLWLDPTATDCVIEDLAFDSIYTGDREKKGMPMGIATRSTNLTVRRCAFYNVGDGLNAATRPRGVLMQDCVAPTLAGLRSYLAWVEGTDQVYLNNFAFNSTREAILRIGNTGGQRVLIAHNTFANLDRTHVDLIDNAKNSLTVQFGSQIYVTGNLLAGGPVMIGPLGDKEGIAQKDWRLRDVVFEGNRVTSFLRVNHGTERLMVRNNRIWADDRAAINVEGFNAGYNRGSSDLHFAHNTAINFGRRGAFIDIGGRVTRVSLVNNLYAAPGLTPGEGFCANVVDKGSHGESFAEVTGNVWAVTRPLPYTKGGVFYAWPGGFDDRGFMTLQRWNQIPQVGTDAQADLPLDVELRPTMILPALLCPPARGVPVDAGGTPRGALTAPGAWKAP